MCVWGGGEGVRVVMHVFGYSCCFNLLYAGGAVLYKLAIHSRGLWFNPLCFDYIKKYSRPIGFLYFYRPINIILSADWSYNIKDITRRLPKSVRKLYNWPIVGRRSADTMISGERRSSADDRPTVCRHIGR